MAEFLFQSPFLSLLQTNVCLQPVGPERTKSWHDGQLYEFKSKLPVAPHLSMTVTEFFILHPGTADTGAAALRRIILSAVFSCTCRIRLLTDNQRNLYLFFLS